MHKFVFVACIFVIVACNHDDRGTRIAYFKIVMAQCKNETGASDENVKNVKTQELMISKIEWCLVGCIKKKTGVLDAKNRIDMAKIKEQMSLLKTRNLEMFNKFVNIMQECKDQVEADTKNQADQCIAAEAISTCVYNKKVTVS